MFDSVGSYSNFTFTIFKKENNKTHSILIGIHYLGGRQLHPDNNKLARVLSITDVAL